MLVLEMPEKEVSVVFGGNFDVADDDTCQLRYMASRWFADLPSMHFNGRPILRKSWQIAHIELRS